MIQRAATGPIDELAGVIVDLRSRLQTLEVIAHRHLFDLDPTTWTAPTLLNGWLDSPGFQGAEYRLVGDVVSLRGVIDSGTVGLPAFVLPPWFAPPADLLFACSDGGAFAELLVASTGDVTPTVGTGTAFGFAVSFSVTV